MCLEGGWVVSTVCRILGGDRLGACNLNSISGIVVGCHGALSVLAWVRSRVGTGCTLGSDTVGFVGSSG